MENIKTVILVLKADKYMVNYVFYVIEYLNIVDKFHKIFSQFISKEAPTSELIVQEEVIQKGQEKSRP